MKARLFRWPGRQIIDQLRRLGRLPVLSCLVLLGALTLLSNTCSNKSHPNTKPATNDHDALTLPVGEPRPHPLFGVHFNYADPPNEVIFEMVQPDKRATLAAALRNAGTDDLRLSFHGYYSHLGPQQTAKLKLETKLTNIFPWFPIEAYIDFIKQYHFTTVICVNMEEGPQVTVDLLERFQKAGALDLITSIELGNEPFLSARPWSAEEYGERCADFIEQIRRFQCKIGVVVIIGKDHNMPTHLSGDDYCERTLTTLGRRIDLKNSPDLYGIIHLYSRGVSPHTIDQLNEIVRKYSNMKYQVTEYNIRLSLEGNPHLTNAYGMEFARKFNSVFVSPDITGLWIHSFPYHSLTYWTDGNKATVIGFTDKKLQGEDLTPGWHLTPAGKVQKFYHDWAWNGQILGFLDRESIQYWAVANSENGTLVSVLNDRSEPLNQEIICQGKQLHLQANPYSIVCYSLNTGQPLAMLTLPHD